jgi:hypothetical protein
MPTHQRLPVTGLELARRASRETSGHKCDCLLHAFTDEVNRLEAKFSFVVDAVLPRTAHGLRNFFKNHATEYEDMACFWAAHNIIDVPMLRHGLPKYTAVSFAEFVQHHGQPNVFLSTIMLPFLAVWLEQYVVPPAGQHKARLLYFGCHAGTRFNEFQWCEPPNLNILRPMAQALTTALQSPEAHGVTVDIMHTWRQDFERQYPRNASGLLDERVQSRLRRELRDQISQDFGMQDRSRKRSTAWEAQSSVPALEVRDADVVICNALLDFHFESCPPTEGRPLLPPPTEPGMYSYHDAAGTVWMDLPRQDLNAAPMSDDQVQAASRAQQQQMMSMIMQLSRPVQPTQAALSISSSNSSTSQPTQSRAAASSPSPPPPARARAREVHEAQTAVHVCVREDGTVAATAKHDIPMGDFVYDANVMQGIHGDIGSLSSPPTILGPPSMTWALYRHASILWVDGADDAHSLVPNVEPQYGGAGGAAPPPVSTMRYQVIDTIPEGAALNIGGISLATLQVFYANVRAHACAGVGSPCVCAIGHSRARHTGHVRAHLQYCTHMCVCVLTSALLYA